MFSDFVHIFRADSALHQFAVHGLTFCDAVGALIFDPIYEINIKEPPAVLRLYPNRIFHPLIAEQIELEIGVRPAILRFCLTLSGDNISSVSICIHSLTAEIAKECGH